MKKIFAVLAMCLLSCSAFGDITVTDWGIFNKWSTVVYDGMVTDIAPAGFSVSADPEMWGEKLRPPVSFSSNSISPSLRALSRDAIDQSEVVFQVRVIGFDDLILNVPETSFEGIYAHDIIRVEFWNANRSDSAPYLLPWNGEGVYSFTQRNLYSYVPVPFDIEYIDITFLRHMNEYHTLVYQFSDNTQGTVEFIFPASAEVPEPSSLLALAFGGAGTGVLALRRKLR